MLSKLSNRGFLSVSGADAETFLQGLITNDIHKLQTQPAIYALMLTPQGKFLYDFFISKPERSYVIEANVERLTELKKKLLMYKLRSKIDITELADLHCFHSLTKPDINEFCAPDPRNNALGYRIYSTNNLGEDDSTTYHEQRISLKIPEGDLDMTQDKSYPLEFGIDELNGIDFSKGCYVGQEVTARTKYRGVVRKKIYGVRTEGSPLQPLTAITCNNIELGSLCSTHKNIALALLRIDETQTALASGMPILAAQDSVELL